MKAVVLGAGRTVVAASGAPVPKCLLEGIAGWRVLDWLLNALREGGGVDDVVFVGGDGMDSIERSYPQLRFVANPNWAEEHVVGSLFAAANELDAPFYFTYADIVYRPDVVKRLREATGDVVIVVDRSWRTRYEGRGPNQLQDAEKVVAVDGRVRRISKEIPLDADIAGEFIGLARFSDRGAAWLRRTYDALAVAYRHRSYRGRRNLHNAMLSDLLQELVEQGLHVDVVEIDGDYAELDAASDLSQFVFGTKAETLERLRPHLRAAEITDGQLVRVGDWAENPRAVADRLASRFGGTPLAVRSSALAEDQATGSAAGRYHSVIGVTGGDVAAITEAVDAVVASYDRDGRRDDDQVLVQPCLTDVAMCGVMMTRDLDSGAEYLVINYDESGRTDGVTSGDATPTATVRVHRGSTARLEDRRLAALVDTASELEAVTGSDALDIEFAFTQDGGLHVLQVRPIARRREWTPVDTRAHADEITSLRSFVEQRQAPVSGVPGSTTILGQMPDWNPAEMIGPFPCMLSRTLYELLITDATWREARAEIGYADVFPHALMVELAGRPFVDVRLSANNLLPASLEASVRGRVVDAGLERLRRHPELHDKIEFDVFPTAFHFRLDDSMRALVEAGLPHEDVEAVKRAVHDHTRALLALGAEGVESFLGRTVALDTCVDKALQDEGDPLVRARTLLAETIRYGTRPFSVLARLSFVGTALLRSLREIGEIGAEDVDDFAASVRTISTELVETLDAVRRDEVSLESFLDRFGHLRPGTYDLLSPRYDQDPHQYFGQAGGPAARRDDVTVDSLAARIDGRLAAAELGIDGTDFLDFLQAAIAGRELAKFRFSKALSAALELIAAAGAEHDLERQDLVHLDAKALLALADAAPRPDRGDELRRRVLAGRLRRERDALIHLPGLIVSEEDVTVVRSSTSRPNFVTGRRVRAEVAVLSPGADVPDLEGKLVVLEGADPGYDWIFTHGIAGLVTRYGGANSHMTIRCAEFGLPAAIGCGDAHYAAACGARAIELDCAGETLRVVA